MAMWPLQNAVGAAVLALVVLGVCRSVRLSPAVRHALWPVVLLKLMAPPFLAWPWALPSPPSLRGGAGLYAPRRGNLKLS